MVIEKGTEGHGRREIETRSKKNLIERIDGKLKRRRKRGNGSEAKLIKEN